MSLMSFTILIREELYYMINYLPCTVLFLNSMVRKEIIHGLRHRTKV